MAQRFDELPTRPQSVQRGVRRHRQGYIDNIRWLMIILVVVMHTCVTYSGMGSWYYKEPSAVGAAGMFVFALYQSFTQAFFMGMLFFIAGTFVPKSYERKGAARFVRGRLFRLGIPSLVFMLLLHPLTMYIMLAFRGDPPGWEHLGMYYRDEILSLHILGDTGPLWFAVALLFFSVVYALSRRAIEWFLPIRSRKSFPFGRGRSVTHLGVISVIVIIGIGSFLVRIVWSIGTSWMSMQFCYFTQYVVLFIAGLWMGNEDRIETLSTRFGMRWLKLSIAVGVPAWLLIGAIGKAASGSMDRFIADMAGGLHWQAAAMAMWEAFFGVSFTIGLLVVYRELMNTRGTVIGFLSANAFGVYVFHTPILVAVSLWLRPWQLPALAKTGVVMTIAVAGSFLFASLIRRITPMRKAFS